MLTLQHFLKLTLSSTIQSLLRAQGSCYHNCQLEQFVGEETWGYFISLTRQLQVFKGKLMNKCNSIFPYSIFKEVINHMHLDS